MGFDLNLIFLKMESLILEKGLSLLSHRIGFHFGFLALLFSAVTGIMDFPLANMMVGSSEGASGTKLPLPSTAAALVPSISSRDYDGIKEFLGLQSEAFSSAPAQGQPQQEGALFQPTQPAPSSSSTGVGPEEMQCADAAFAREERGGPIGERVGPSEGWRESMGASTSSHPAPWMASSSSEPSDLMVAVNQFYPSQNPTIGESGVPPIAAPEEERAVLPARINIIREIESSVEDQLRRYCDRPNVATQIDSKKIDFSALARCIDWNELEVDCLSTEDLLSMFGYVQKCKNIKPLFDDLFSNLP